jgi:type I restriction-modification system DNA methylase subunit
MVASLRVVVMPKENEAGAGAMDRDVAKRAETKSTYFGQDLVARPRRMALMNLYLHGVEPQIILRGHHLRSSTGKKV